MKNLFLKVCVAATGMAASVAAFALPQDYSGIETAITAEITAAMPTVLVVAGTLLGIGVGLRLLKRGGKF